MAPNKHTFHRPAWIFYDLDDTLWDFSKNSQKSLLHVFEKYDTIRSVFSCYSEFEDEYHLHNARLWREFAQGRVSTPVLKSERWRLTLFPDSDPSDPPAVCREIDTEYLRFLACQPYTVDGALPMLSRLSKRFMIGAISNGFKDTQYRKLSNSGLGRYISRIIISDEAGIQKPDAGIFAYTVSETGATGTPLMVGDSVDNDILGALGAGWKAIWFNRTENPFPYTAGQLEAKGIDPALFLGTAASMSEVEAIINKSFFNDADAVKV